MHLANADLPDALFAPCPRLTRLSLAGNRLTEVRPAWLTGQPTLATLELQNNTFSALLPGAFDALAATLASVDLSYNLLTALPDALFGVPFPALKSANFKENLLAAIPAELYANTPAMEDMWVCFGWAPLFPP